MNLIVRPSSNTITVSLPFMQAVFLATIMLIMPWELIMRADHFTDFERYVEYFNRETEFTYIVQGYDTFWNFISGEALWNVLNIVLTDLIGDARYSLRLFSWITFFLWAFLIIKRANFLLAVLFLFNPVVIDVGMSGIRNGLAWSLFFFAVYEVKSLLRLLVILSTIFIHTTAIFLVVIYVLYIFRSSRARLLSFFDMYYGFILGTIVLTAPLIIFYYLPDRRLVDYIRGDPSVLQSIYFYVIFFLFFVSVRKRTFDLTSFFSINLIGLYI